MFLILSRTSCQASTHSMFNVVAQALTLLPVDIKTPHCRHSPDSAQHSTRAGLTRRRPVLVGFFVAPHQLAQLPRSRASVPSTIVFANRAHDNTPMVYSSLFCLESVMSFCSNRENGECSPTHFSRNVISLCEQLFHSILLPASVPPRPQSAAASATPKVLGWPRWEIGPMWFTFSAVGHGHLCLNDFTTLSRPATLSPLPHDLHVIAALFWPLLFLVFLSAAYSPVARSVSYFLALYCLLIVNSSGGAKQSLSSTMPFSCSAVKQTHTTCIGTPPLLGTTNSSSSPSPPHSISLFHHGSISRVLRTPPFHPKEVPLPGIPSLYSMPLPHFRWQHGSPFQHRPARQ
jgi:hypothetical protein